MNLESVLPTDPTRSDLADLERAVRLRWILPDKLASELPKRLEELTRHSDPRVVLRSIRTLAELNRQNAELAGNEQGGDSGGVVIYLPSNGREMPGTVYGELPPDQR